MRLRMADDLSICSARATPAAALSRLRARKTVGSPVPAKTAPLPAPMAPFAPRTTTRSMARRMTYFTTAANEAVNLLIPVAAVNSTVKSAIPQSCQGIRPPRKPACKLRREGLGDLGHEPGRDVPGDVGHQ